MPHSPHDRALHAAPPDRSPGGNGPLAGLRTALSPNSDRRLVTDCLAGSEEAWAALVHKYKNLIYSIPLRYGADPADAADIFQAVCIELFHELPRLRNADSLRSWLMTVAAHQSYHWKRRHLRRAEKEVEGLEEEALPAVLPPDVAAELEREQLVREVVAALPPRCREMVRLLFYEDPPVSYAEVAQRFGLATGSIGFMRGRCLNRLQKALEELGF